MTSAMVSGLSDTPLSNFLKDLYLELGSKEPLHSNLLKLVLTNCWNIYSSRLARFHVCLWPGGLGWLFRDRTAR
jgi:hypothetical protein